MRLRVRLFATYRELVGSNELTWTAADGERLGAFVTAFLAEHPRLAAHRDSMMLAVNRAVASPDVVLHDGDEVALLPPVSGGSA